MTAVVGDPCLDKLGVEPAGLQRELPKASEALGVLEALVVECLQLGDYLVVCFAHAKTVIVSAAARRDGRIWRLAGGKSEPPKRRLSAAELTDQRRDEIYAAAVRVFADNGFRDASIAQIAAEMGVGHGTIYRYFENKSAIGEYVVGKSIVRLGAVIAAEPATATNSADEYREQVGRIGAALFDLFVHDPDLAAVLFFVAGELDSELREQVRRAFDVLSAATEQYLINGVEKGFLDPHVDTFTTASAINAMIFEGARRVHVADDPAREGQRWIGVVQRLMFDSLKPKT